MARKKRSESSVIVHKNVLPVIDLEGSSTTSVTTPDNSNTAARTVVERHPEFLFNKDNTLLDSEDHLNDDEYFNELNSEDDDNMIHFNNKRKNKDTEKEKDTQKKIRITLTIKDMQNVQNQLVTMVQDMHKKINEMHTDWNATGFSNHTENDTKWLEDTINYAVSTVSEKIKYPSEECLMKVCYDALLNANEEEFQTKIKRGGWKHFYNKNVRTLAQQISRQLRSNIVQCIKNAIHTEFPELTKPKTQNRQVTRDEEQKFKNSNITQECYTKLNKPVDSNDDPQYTYLNLIIDRVFTSPKTEKNSIAFGMAIALNYLDPSKGVNMVPSDVVERMNYFLNKMQVSDRESL